MTTDKQLIKSYTKFLERTKFREYCSTICRGQCCIVDDCYAKLHNDWEHCHQKLTCTMYTCRFLWNIVKNNTTPKEYNNLNDMETLVHDFLYEHLYSMSRADTYFEHYCLVNFSIRITFPKISDSTYIKISNHVDNLIKSQGEYYGSSNNK